MLAAGGAWDTSTRMLPPTEYPCVTLKRANAALAMTFPLPGTPHLNVLPVLDGFALFKARIPVVPMQPLTFQGAQDEVMVKCAVAN